MPLNEKQTRFAHAYIACGGNGRAAAIQAGYSHTSAAKRACDLLKVPEVQDIVQTHRDAVLRATEDFDVVEELIEPLSGCRWPRGALPWRIMLWRHWGDCRI